MPGGGRVPGKFEEGLSRGKVPDREGTRNQITQDLGGR